MDLIINEATKHEVLFCLDLMKMTQLTNPLCPYSLVICVNSKSMRSYLELTLRDMKRVQLMMRCVGGLDNEFVPHLYEALMAEGHLGT